MDRLRVVGLLLAAILVGTLNTRLAFAQTDATEPRVARLVRNLGADDYGTRRAADLELLSLGAESLEQLRKAAKSSDLEVRLRAENILQRIAVARLWEPATVTLKADDESLGKLLSQCAQQTGNRVCVGDPYGEFVNQRTTVAYDRVPYWQVLDELARSSGNLVRPHYDTRLSGVVMVKGKPPQYPTAYAGPVRAQITSAKRVFSENLDYEALASDVGHTFQLNVQMTWEDRVQLAAYATQPEVVSARTDSGEELAIPQNVFDGWNVMSNNTRLLSASLKLNPPAEQATKLATLRLRWPLVALGEMDTVEIDEPVAKSSVELDGIAVKVASFSRQPTGRVELSLIVARNLPIPNPPDVLFQENVIELLDAQGRALRQQNQFHSLGERGVEFRLSYVADSADQTPAKLRVSYPKIRSRRDLEIVFTDVPLPVARPE
jgi:hypothetical protein